MNIVQISIALHYCIQNLHLLHFKTKVACICIPKIMFISAQISLEDKRPSQRVNILFSIRSSPLVLAPFGLFHRTQSPYFIFHRAQSPLPFSHRTQSSLSFTLSETITVSFCILETIQFVGTQRQIMIICPFSKTSMSFD